MAAKFEELESRELLNVIIEEVKKAAEEECRRIIEEAKREAAKIVEEAKQEAERRRRELEERVRREARLKARRRLALKRLEIRRNFLAAREGVIREILEEARRRILEVAEGGGEEYRRALKSLVTRSMLKRKRRSKRLQLISKRYLKMKVPLKGRSKRKSKY